MYLALVPNAVTPSCSLNSQRLRGVGLNGLPSNTRIVVPAESAPTSHGHIIHAQVVNWKKTSLGVKSQWRTCSFLIWRRRGPPAWTIGLGKPVVPEEYRMMRGWSNGSGVNSRGALGTDRNFSDVTLKLVNVSQAVPVRNGRYIHRMRPHIWEDDHSRE